MKNGKNNNSNSKKISLHAWDRSLETKSFAFSEEEWEEIVKIEKEYLNKGCTVTLKKVGS